MQRVMVTVLVVLSTLASGAARADRKPPFGADAGLLEARVREEIERKIAPTLTELAPGQAELKYVEVRVTRPTALPTGASPGFEDLSPAAEYVAEKAEVSLLLDAKLPADFRKNLRGLLKHRLDGLGVPVEFVESVVPFPAPRPQPAAREPMPYYPAPPPPVAAAPAPAPAPVAPPPVPAPATDPAVRALAVAAVVLLGLLVVALMAAAAWLLLRRRADKVDRRDAAVPAGAVADKSVPAAIDPGIDRLPDVRRALTEDRVLARRVVSDLLVAGELEKVARTVELVGPAVVEDLRADPACAVPLRDAAALLDRADPQTAVERRQLADELYRRILKHRMIGAGDPVEQEFAFLVGLPKQRFAAVLAGERPSVQAAALRYAPAHLRAGYLADSPPEERNSLVAALADPKAPTRDYLMDIATTLRRRAAEQVHVGGGEATDVDLLVEMLEDRSPEEQQSLLETMRRLDAAKWRRVQASLVTEDALVLVPEEALAAAALAVPPDALALFLRGVAESARERTLRALPAAVAAGVREDAALDAPIAADRAAEARRALHRALRKALRDRGLAMPATAPGSDEGGRVVAL